MSQMCVATRRRRQAGAACDREKESMNAVTPATVATLRRIADREADARKHEQVAMTATLRALAHNLNGKRL